MEVVETFTASRTGRSWLNEDAIFTDGPIAAVFDGETTSTGHVESTPGRLAATACAEACGRLTPGAAPEAVSEHLHRAVEALDVSPEAAAVGAVVDATTRRVIRVGDVSVGVDGVFDIITKRVDLVAARARAALIHAHLAAGTTADQIRAEDPGRAMVLPLIRSQRVWRNRPHPVWGFAVIDGSGTPPSMIDVIEVPAGSEVVLATDGYVSPASSLAASEAALAASLAQDPLRVGMVPATKAVSVDGVSFDDRSYVRVRL